MYELHLAAGAENLRNVKWNAVKVISSPDIRRYSFIGTRSNFILILNPPLFFLDIFWAADQKDPLKAEMLILSDF